jgi:hypothetical protein
MAGHSWSKGGVGLSTSAQNCSTSSWNFDSSPRRYPSPKTTRSQRLLPGPLSTTLVALPTVPSEVVIGSFPRVFRC